MWTNRSLQTTIKENFKDYRFIIVSHREPYTHHYNDKGKVVSQQTIGGVSITLDSIMKTAKGVWVAHGIGEADRDTVNEQDQVRVPPQNPQYTLKRIWINDEEYKGYYEGFSNQTLWPLCHVVFRRPTFREEDWKAYKAVNRRFAEAVLEEMKGSDKNIVWIHDYQLALAAKYIKEKRPETIVAQFWHIPWPTYEIFRICPWKHEIIKGLLCNDLLGFHRFYHVDNFLSTVIRELECKVDREDLIVDFKGHKTRVGFFPISIDVHDIESRLKGLAGDQKVVDKYVESPYETLIIGIDRIDYTKGITNRLSGIEKFFEDYPKYRGKVVYLSIAAPSRSSIAAYRELEEKLIAQAAAINKRFGQKDWQPIYFVNQIIDRNEILQICRLANVCLVTSLDDGMNLACKEYVSANGGDGALVLSSFTGAAKELTEAFQVNPYDTGSLAKTIKLAIETPLEERQRRMKTMKEVIRKNNLFRWASKFLLALVK